MNSYHNRAIMLKHQIRLAAQLESNPIHSRHIEQFFEYADAIALADAQDALTQATKIMEQNNKKASLEIDSESVKKVKNAINEMFSPLKSRFR